MNLDPSSQNQRSKELDSQIGNQPKSRGEYAEHDEESANQESKNLEMAFTYELHGDRYDDSFQYLETSDSSDTIAFNARQNARTEAVLHDDRYEEICQQFRSKNTPDDIQMPLFGENVVIKFKAEPDNPKGIIYVAEKEVFLRDKDRTEFEVLLDINQLALKEGRDWFYKGMTHKPKIGDRALIFLSDGGGDSVLVREFDLVKREILAEGFRQEGLVQSQYDGKSDTILFAVPDSPENTSSSQYPLEVRRWDRSCPISESPLLFKADSASLGVGISRVQIEKDSYRSIVSESIDFYSKRVHVLSEDGLTTLELPLPLKHDTLAVNAGLYIFRPNEDFKVDGINYIGGVVAFHLNEFLACEARRFTALFNPLTSQSVSEATIHESRIYLSIVEDVAAKLLRADFSTEDLGSGAFTEKPTFTEIALPGKGTLSALSSLEKVGVLVGYSDFVTPTSYYFLSDNDTLGEAFLSKPEKFNASQVEVRQEFAVSKDGTRIPFFILDGRQDQSQPAPTIQYGYGGFKISIAPTYNWTLGSAWLEQGNVYVMANIRGGGEYGPAWHQAALKENRPKAYEDFKAVADKLIELGVTTSQQLGALGRSNGGLLTGNMLTRYPETFGAIISAVPLLDMLRYDQLSRGASWQAEFGASESVDDYPALLEISPYHKIVGGPDYPPTMFTTSATDDRVHPGHARKMAAKMQNLGFDQTYFYERSDGGHNNTDFNSWIPDVARQYRFFEKFLIGD